MDLEISNIPSDTPEDIVQFIRHLEENLKNASEDYDCEIRLTPVSGLSHEELPSSDIPNPPKGPLPEYGVRVEVWFEDNNDCPNQKISQLTKSFYGYQNYILSGHFDGGKGEYVTYIFEAK